MAKKYSLEMQLKKMSTTDLDNLIKKLEKLKKLQDEIEKNKITIGAKTDSSFKNVMNQIEKIPDEKKIKITANSDMNRALDTMNREIISANNRLQQSLESSIRSMMGNVNASISSAVKTANNSISRLNSAMSSGIGISGGGTTGVRSTASNSVGRSVGGSIGGSLIGGTVAGAISGGLNRRNNSNKSNNTTSNRGSGKLSNKVGSMFDNIKNFKLKPNEEELANAKNTLSNSWLGKAGKWVGGKVNKATEAAADYTNNKLFPGAATMNKMMNPKASNKRILTLTLKDLASKPLSKVKSLLSAITKPIHKASLWLKDKASSGVKKVKSIIKSVTSPIHAATVIARDKASNVVNKVKGTLRSITGSKVWKAVVSAADKATQIVKKIGSTLKSLVKTTWKIAVSVIDKASSVLKGIGSKLASLAKGAVIGVGAAAGAGLTMAVNGASTQEQNKVSMQHFIERFNGMEAGGGAAQMEEYVGSLANLANKTPFETQDVMAGGRRAVQIAGGDTKEATRLTTLAADIAAMNPGKSVGDAMEMLADLKMGETARAVEFGFKWSQDDVNAAGGADEFFKKVTSEGGDMYDLYSGGADKLASTFGGLWSTITGKGKSAFAALGTPITEALKGPMQDFIDGPLQTFLDKAPEIGQSMVDGFKKAYTMAKPLLDVVKNIGKSALDIGKNTVKNVFKSNKGKTDDNGQELEPTAFDGFIDKAAEVKNMISGLFDGISSSGITDILTSVGNTFLNVGTLIGDAILACEPIIQTFGDVFNWVFPMIEQIVSDVAPVISGILESMKPFFNAIREAVLFVMQAVQEAWPIIADVISVAGEIIKPVLEIIGNIAMFVVDVFRTAWPYIKDAVEGVWEFVKPIFEWIAGAIQGVSDAVSSCIQWFRDLGSSISDTFSKIKDSKWNPFNWFDGSHANGLEEVPYDGYIAELHKGETVLTANEKRILDYKLDKSSTGQGGRVVTNSITTPVSVVINGIQDPEAMLQVVESRLETKLVGVITNAVRG